MKTHIFSFSSTDETNMQVSDKDINVYGDSCLSDTCQENCLKAVSLDINDT